MFKINLMKIAKLTVELNGNYWQYSSAK